LLVFGPFFRIVLLARAPRSRTLRDRFDREGTIEGLSLAGEIRDFV
jgi:hypothetical protein